MSVFESLFGKTLKTKTGEVETSSALSGKVCVGLYFSAHWCPPCRRFTPTLAEFYNKHKDSKNFELVFVSWDNETESFEEYYNDMPWLAVPFEEASSRVGSLNSKFKVNGIPNLIFLDSKGEIITKAGRYHVEDDPQANSFPWYPKTFREIISGSLIKSNKDLQEKTQFSELKGKTIGIYFSAHWCPPCRKLTPIITEFYTKHKETKNLEIIFSSLDKEEEAFKEYYGTMPWLALPFKDQRCKELNLHFNVSGIPHLVLVDEEGNLICPDAAEQLPSDPEGNNFPWPIKPVYPFGDMLVRHVNEEPVLCVQFPQEQVEENIAKLTQVIEGLPKDKKIYVFIYTDAQKDSGELDKVFKFAGVEEQKPEIVLLDVIGSSYYVSSEKSTFESVKKVVLDFASGNLEMKMRN